MIGRLPIAKMLAATVAMTAAISAVMVSINWDGQEASTAAPKIDDLLNVMIVLSSFVFSLVMVMLFYALYKFKAKPGDESDGEPIHGNTKLEIAWTVIPTIIVLFGAGYSWSVLNDIEAKAADSMRVDVFSQQYSWSFGYPGFENHYTEDELHVPDNRQIEFKMHALDVIHSFWVPEWRIKKDNVPGSRRPPSSPRTGSAPISWSAPSSAASATRRCGPKWWWNGRRTSVAGSKA